MDICAAWDVDKPRTKLSNGIRHRMSAQRRIVAADALPRKAHLKTDVL